MRRYISISLLAMACAVAMGQEGSGGSGEGGAAVIYGSLFSYEAPKHDSIRYECYTGPLWYYPEGEDYRRGVSQVRDGSIMDGIAPGDERLFEIRLDSLKGPSYITLSLGVKDPLIYRYLIRPGDTIWMKMDYTRGHILFGGPEAKLFQCQYLLNWLRFLQFYSGNPTMLVEEGSESSVWKSAEKRAKFPDSKRKMELVVRGEEELDSFREAVEHRMREWYWERMEILETFRDDLDIPTYRILHANVWGDILVNLASKFNRSYKYATSRDDNGMKSELERVFRPIMKYYDEKYFPEEVIRSSWRYRNYLEYRAMGYQRIEGGTNRLEFLQRLEVSSLRDLLSTKHLIERFTMKDGMEQRLKEIYPTVEDPYCRLHLQILRDKWLDQKVAPLALPDTEGRTVDIRDLEGKVVLLDFWFTGCKPCIWFHTTSLSKVKDHFAEEEDFVVLSVSVDPTRELWLKSVASGQYTSDAAINVHIKGRDHPFLKAYSIQGYPTVLLVDREGRMTGSAVPRDAEEMIEVIERELD